MNLINQSCEAYIQEPGLNGIYKQIERAGRTCYKSSDKITEDSAKPFVERMIKERDALSEKIVKAEKGAREIEMTEMSRSLLYAQISAMKAYRDILHSRLLLAAGGESKINTR